MEYARSLIIKAKTYYSAWLAATTDEQNKQSTVVTQECWIKPQHGFMKLNVDAAINKEEDCMGFGCVLRDEHRHFIAVRGAQWRGTLTSKEVEAVAIRESLSWLKSLTVNNIIIETDSQQVFQSYNSGVGESSQISKANLMILFTHSSLVCLLILV